MITDILINNVATYNSLVRFDGLKKINFVFGANGTGKTTISRVIEQVVGHTHCTVQWAGGTRLEAMVYNRDFVEKNFNQHDTVKGVFTLGDNQVEAEREIARLMPEIAALDNGIRKINIQLHGEDGLSGKTKELADLEPTLRDRCWRQKQLHDEYFQVAFSGVRNNAERFKERVVTEAASNQAELLNLEQLKEKSKTIFSSSLERVSRLPSIDLDELIKLEDSSILQKIIIGNQDVDIAAIINQLGNSDWVKQGLHYHKQDQSVCPFCQQSTDENFGKSLNNFFSGTYDSDVESVENFLTQYEHACTQASSKIKSIFDTQSTFLENTLFSAESQTLYERFERNKIILQSKLSEPSQKVALESIELIALQLQGLIDKANESIDSHNQTVTNISSEKSSLTNQVWRYVIDSLNENLTQYQQNKLRLERTIEGMQISLREKNERKREFEAQTKELERQSTSILPTKDSINGLLQTFGFNSFRIEVVDNHGHYKICRGNGDDASRSLSEGEKTFITFLYFYSLIKGAHSSTGTTSNRVIAFDDPISSLDSDILYIVSSLIKGIFDEVRNGNGYIKQVFVLTHNVYFHKEVSFHKNRCRSDAMNDESFWIVKKLIHGSTIERCLDNPIKSAYELLWDDIKSPNPSNLTIQNTLRRIIENYFTMWGGKSKDEICALFNGREKLVCQSLFSWVNDGSHSIHDDLYINHGEQSNEAFLSIFKEIFLRSDQIGHFNMMMGVLPSAQDEPREEVVL